MLYRTENAVQKTLVTLPWQISSKYHKLCGTGLQTLDTSKRLREKTSAQNQASTLRGL